MYFYLLILAGIVVLATLFLYVRSLSSEKGRIISLVKVYKHHKQKYPNQSESYYLARVVEHHIPHGSGNRLGDKGISGEKYLSGIWEEKVYNLTLGKLVEHIISLEFPDKYKINIDVEQMFENAQTVKLTPRDELKTVIRNCIKNI